MGYSLHSMQKILSCQCWLQTSGDLQYYEPDTLADGIQKRAASKYTEWLVFTKVFPGKDALGSSYGTVAFPPTPPHITGPTLNAACAYRGEEGRKQIHDKPNSGAALTLQGSEQSQGGLRPFFPPPGQQQDQGTNNRGQSLSAIVFQPPRPEPLAHIRSAANPNVFT